MLAISPVAEIDDTTDATEPPRRRNQPVASDSWYICRVVSSQDRAAGYHYDHASFVLVDRMTDSVKSILACDFSDLEQLTAWQVTVGQLIVSRLLKQRDACRASRPVRRQTTTLPRTT
jgi:hypothetical protein